MRLFKLKNTIFLFLAVFLLAFVSADSCSIVPKASCNSQNVLVALSGTTNAHGGLLADSPLYGYVVCCDFFEANSDCSQGFSVLKLSAVTNAHAEVPSGTSYGTRICYSYMNCISQTGGVCPVNYPISIASLSSATDAHIGGFADYSTKICCVVPVPVCGDGVKRATEDCDDGNLNNLDGCSSSCIKESGWNCTGSPSVCAPIHGDGLITGSEECDDGNIVNGDGCSSLSIKESGWNCTGSPSVCAPIHGDGLITGSEECDDGNIVNGDGCSSLSIIELGWTCTGSPSVCVAIAWNKYGTLTLIGEGTDFPNLTISTVNPTPVSLLFKSLALEDGITVFYEVWEEDFLGDDYITTIEGVYHSSTSSAVGVWEIDPAEISEDISEVYFVTATSGEINVQETSNLLKLIKYEGDLAECEEVVTCESYKTKDSCELNDCSINQFGDLALCGQKIYSFPDREECYYEVDCSCKWNNLTNTCGASSEQTINQDCMDISLKSFGECTFVPLGGTNNCGTTGKFEYKWDAVWDWGENNYSTEEEVMEGTEEPIQTPDGYWHYPTLLQTSCIAGEKSINCPAKIALPAYSAFGLVLALIIIILAYYFFFANRKKKKVSRKKKK